MRILVVGGAGYIGSHVTLALLDGGHQVTVFDNMSTGREENLFPDALFVKGDITSPGDLERLLAIAEFDAVMHFAGLKSVGDSMSQPENYSRQNMFGSMNLINTSVKYGVRYFIFSSSAAVFGEPEWLPVDEKHPKRPTNFYGYTKLQIEHHLAWYHQLRGLNYACLRYFNAAGYDMDRRVIGREMSPQNLVPVMMEVALGERECLNIFGNDYPTRDGTCLRDYVHVTDLAVAHIRALEYLVAKKLNLDINLGTETGHTVKEVVAATETVIGKKLATRIVARRCGDSAALVASPELARRILDWNPRYKLEDMLASAWAICKP